MLTHAIVQVSSYSDIKLILLLNNVDEPVAHITSMSAFE
jgi:hypothetical protein